MNAIDIDASDENAAPRAGSAHWWALLAERCAGCAVAALHAGDRGAARRWLGAATDATTQLSKILFSTTGG